MVNMVNICGCIECNVGKSIFDLNFPFDLMVRYTCEICGNKRCPHHRNHTFKCTNNNKPYQIGESEC